MSTTPIASARWRRIPVSPGDSASSFSSRSTDRWKSDTASAKSPGSGPASGGLAETQHPARITQAGVGPGNDVPRLHVLWRQIDCLLEEIRPLLEDLGRLLPSCRVLARSDLVAGFRDCARSRPVEEGITLDDEVDAFLGFSLGLCGQGSVCAVPRSRAVLMAEARPGDRGGRGNQFLVPTGPSKRAFHHTGTTGQNGLVVHEPPQIGGKLLGGRVPARGCLFIAFRTIALRGRGSSAQRERSAGACNATFDLAGALAEGDAAGRAAATAAGFADARGANLRCQRAIVQRLAPRMSARQPFTRIVARRRSSISRTTFAPRM